MILGLKKLQKRIRMRKTHPAKTGKAAVLRNLFVDTYRAGYGYINTDLYKENNVDTVDQFPAEKFHSDEIE